MIKPNRENISNYFEMKKLQKIGHLKLFFNVKPTLYTVHKFNLINLLYYLGKMIIFKKVTVYCNTVTVYSINIFSDQIV